MRAPRLGNVRTARPKDAAYKRQPSTGGGSAPGGKSTATPWGKSHMRISAPGTTCCPDVCGNVCLLYTSDAADE
eukprot:8000407-Heterocapsa_arctica.AAC.1